MESLLQALQVVADLEEWDEEHQQDLENMLLDEQYDFDPREVARNEINS